MPPHRACQRPPAPRTSHLGVLAFALGVQAIVGAQDHLSETYGKLLVVIGLFMHVQELQRHQQLAGHGQFGPQGSYNMSRKHTHIETMVAEKSERLFKGWFQSVYPGHSLSFMSS
jgi:hypothetical protein